MVLGSSPPMLLHLYNKQRNHQKNVLHSKFSKHNWQASSHRKYSLICHFLIRFLS